MNQHMNPPLDWERARAVLGVAPEATEAEVRAAYLAKVQQHPPDRDPEQFELVRDAYQQLRNPRLRAMRVMQGPAPFSPFAELFGDASLPSRHYAGVDHWLAALKEKR